MSLNNVEIVGFLVSVEKFLTHVVTFSVHAAVYVGYAFLIAGWCCADDLRDAIDFTQAPSEESADQWSRLLSRGWAGVEVALVSSNAELRRLAIQELSTRGVTCVESLLLTLVKAADHQDRSRIVSGMRSALGRSEAGKRQLLREVLLLRERTMSGELRELCDLVSAPLRESVVIGVGGLEAMTQACRSRFESVRWLAIRQMSWAGMDIVSEETAGELFEDERRRAAANKAVAVMLELVQDDTTANRLAVFECLGWYGKHGVMEYEIINALKKHAGRHGVPIVEDYAIDRALLGMRLHAAKKELKRQGQ